MDTDEKHDIEYYALYSKIAISFRKSVDHTGIGKIVGHISRMIDDVLFLSLSLSSTQRKRRIFFLTLSVDDRDEILSQANDFSDDDRVRENEYSRIVSSSSTARCLSYRASSIQSPLYICFQ